MNLLQHPWVPHESLTNLSSGPLENVRQMLRCGRTCWMLRGHHFARLAMTCVSWWDQVEHWAEINILTNYFSKAWYRTCDSTTTKVDGATFMYWYIMGPYYTTSGDFRLHFSDCYILELQLVQLLVISPIQSTVTMSPKDLSVQSFVDPFNSFQTTEIYGNLETTPESISQLPLLSMIPWRIWNHGNFRTLVRTFYCPHPPHSQLITNLNNLQYIQAQGPAYLLPPHWPKLWLSHPSYEPLELRQFGAVHGGCWNLSTVLEYTLN